MGSVGLENWNSYLATVLACLNFCVFNRPKTPPSLFRGFGADKPLLLVVQAVEFKFESMFKPLQVIWQSLPKAIQKIIKGFDCKINGWAFLAVSTCLRKKCCHSYFTDLALESKGVWLIVKIWPVRPLPYEASVFYMGNGISMEFASMCYRAKQHSFLCSILQTFIGLWVK